MSVSWPTGAERFTTLVADGVGRLEIGLAEMDDSGMSPVPDLRLVVAVDCCGFSGRCDRAWVGGQAFQSFLGELAVLEATRRGEATIEAFSPDTLLLRVASTDGVGHILVEGFVGDSMLGPNQRRVESKVGYSFDLDPSTLPSFVKRVRGLVAERGS